MWRSPSTWATTRPSTKWIRAWTGRSKSRSRDDPGPLQRLLGLRCAAHLLGAHADAARGLHVQRIVTQKKDLRGGEAGRGERVLECPDMGFNMPRQRGGKSVLKRGP